MGEALITRRGGGNSKVYDAASASGAVSADLTKYIISGMNLSAEPKAFYILFYAYRKLKGTDGSGSSGTVSMVLEYIDGAATWYEVTLSGSTRTFTNRGAFTFEVKDGNLEVSLSNDIYTVTFSSTSPGGLLGGLVAC